MHSFIAPVQIVCNFFRGRRIILLNTPCRPICREINNIFLIDLICDRPTAQPYLTIYRDLRHVTKHNEFKAYTYIVYERRKNRVFVIITI